MKPILIFISLLFVCSSCSKWLDEEPKAVSETTFYNTEKEAAAAILAPLYKFRSGFTTFYSVLMECFSDYQYGRGSFASTSDYVGLDPQNVSRTDAIWSCLYNAVRDCNIGISRLPNASELSDQQKNAYIGELRFIRAFAYFTLVRLWSSVPLRTEINMKEWDLAKAPVNDIYNFIIVDLEFAIANCPQRERLIGTPSQYAAQGLLAQVHMQLKNYQEAYDLLKTIVDSKRYALVPVANAREFEKIFGPDVINTSEEVFYFKNTRTAGWEFVMFCSHPNARIDGEKMHGAGGYYGLYTKSGNRVFDSWDDVDLRKAYNALSFDLGLGFPTYLPTKFYDPLAPNSTGAANSNPILRYADLLLLYAEAANELNNGPTADALEKVNMIHRRAYGFAPNEPSAIDCVIGDYTSKSDFLQLIIKEQAYENWNEGKRWLFLNRLGMAAEKIMEAKGLSIQEKHYLFPIPAGEFNYNEALDAGKDQNPSY